MTIGTDAARGFFGTQDTLGTSSSAVSDDAFSVAADLSTWVDTDNALKASVILLANFSVAPTANSAIILYLRLLDIQSTNDQSVPNANFKHVMAGRFPLDATTSAQYCPIDIFLPGTKESQNYEFYLHNLSGQSLPAGWDIFVTPKATGPVA